MSSINSAFPHVSIKSTFNTDLSFSVFSPTQSSPHYLKRSRFSTTKMVTQVSVGIFLFTIFVVRSEIYLDNTEDGLNIQFYDCVRLQSLHYCRRPKDPINLKRDNDTHLCEKNDGRERRFSELRLNNISANTILHQWRSTLERAERYARYLTDSNQADQSICQCLKRGSFGKNCEYQLPVGQTFEETLEWQLDMRRSDSQNVQIYGDIVCYDTLKCNSGLLCLDWREICDGIQHCLDGRDEENCDLLEMNECDSEEEYRCENGMCIPQEFFLDGEFDCLDWSDEILFKNDDDCSLESVSSECDDHLCPSNHWSCGDGQCIEDRLRFQRLSMDVTCHSGRDQYFLCETHLSFRQWTLLNGRCLRDDQYQPSLVTNRSNDERCTYLVKCLLSRDLEMNCSCHQRPECVEELDRVCRPSSIFYPREAVITPFTFFLYNRRRDWRNKRPDWIMINGTVRCRGMSVRVRNKIIPFDINWNERQIIEEHFCRPFLSNISSSNTISISNEHFNLNESLDRCGEWKAYSSSTRIRDGLKNCLNGKDEEEQTEIEIEKTCVRVRRHRFHCSQDQSTCLSVTRLGMGLENCRNGFDELFFGVGRTISSIGCNDQRQDECFLLRQYISESSTSRRSIDVQRRSKMLFRSHCDTFSDLLGEEDEDLHQCQNGWVCPKDQKRCRTGQCVERSWIDDDEWDCPDAEDEHDGLNWITRSTLQRASEYNLTGRSFFVPSTCPFQSHPFLCLSSEAIQQGFSCFNLSQIGNGRIDCLGGLDEQNTLQHCSSTPSSSSSILGPNFFCSSTQTCIPFYFHCWTDEYRCPNRSDDQFWCDRERRPSNCSDLNDFVCFDGRCLKGGRCNRLYQCPFFEDEYMCDYPSSLSKGLVAFRKLKRLSRRRKPSILVLSLYPSDVNITQFSSESSLIISTVPPPITPLVNPPLSYVSPYWCNRGLGILLTTNHRSVVCFCPPPYYGDFCQFHTDRLSVLLHLDLSQSIFVDHNNRKDLLQLLVLFLFDNDKVLMIEQFRLHPFKEINSLLNNEKKRKLISHFLYPRSSTFLHQRRERFVNRSSLLTSPSPFSVRIELYQISLDERPSIMAVWKYPLSFSHLPVSRLAKVLRFSPSATDHANPCSSRPCRHPNEECHPLMNDRSEYLCLCRSNFTGENCSREDQQCRQDYCSMGSLCQPNSRSLLQDDSSSPFCLCPLNRFSRQCSIKHDGCLSSPCRHNGSCFPDLQSDRVICLCLKEYFGSHCQWKRTSIHLSLSTDLDYRGVVLQVLQIDLSSLELILLEQRVFLQLPSKMDYYHLDQSLITGIVLSKVYSSDQVHFPDVHLLSVYQHVSFLHGTVKMSLANRCEHRRTFSNGNSSSFLSIISVSMFFFRVLETSPIRYHQLCMTDPSRLCFRDDVYLCICGKNHSRVECFNYDDELDRCSNCRSNGRCLQGNSPQSNDFVCLCSECHSGRHCQFNTKSFSFTLDQLFSPDLLSVNRRRTMSLLIFFPILGFFLAIPSNLFSFFTLRRRSCLRQGVGHYLLAISLVNQFSLALLAARLVHLSVIVAISRSSSPWIDDFFCKLLTYLLTCSTRVGPWLSSFVALERVYSVVFFNRHWFKQPHIARSLILFTILVILLSAFYELVFVKSFASMENGNSTMCVIEYSSSDQSMWILIHQIVSVSHFLFPLLINLCSTLTIMGVVVTNKMNIRVTAHCKCLFYTAEYHTFK